jgi:hypothetical protein
MRKILYCFSIIILLAAFGIMTLIGYWYFWPDNIITVTNPLNIKVDKEVYKPGDRITYTFDYCKDRDMIGLISKALVNDIRIVYTSIHSNLSVGCHKATIGSVIIPEYVPDGSYHLEVTGEYQINPIRTYTVFLQTVEFTIKGK